MIRLQLNQTAVYWAPIGADNYGKPTWAAPVQYPCRWEDVFEETIDNKGNIVYSAAVVYFSVDILVSGLLMLGLLQDLGSNFPAYPKADPRVHEVINKGRVPSLRADQYLTRVMLK